MTGARPDSVEIRSTAIISDAFATGENGLPFADDQNSLPFAIGEGEGWGGVRRAPMWLSRRSNPLPTSPCAARKGRSHSSTGQNSLPFAIGEREGWGGVRRAPMSLGCRSNPLPTCPCAARKGRSRSSTDQNSLPFAIGEGGEAWRYESPIRASLSALANARAGRVGEGFAGRRCGWVAGATPSQPPPALRARGGAGRRLTRTPSPALRARRRSRSSPGVFDAGLALLERHNRQTW